MAACAFTGCSVCPWSSASLPVVGNGSGRIQGRGVASLCAPMATSVESSTSSTSLSLRAGYESSSSSFFGRLSSCPSSSSNRAVSTRRRNAVCEVAVKIGEEQGTSQVGPGAKIRVTVPIKVYHVSKLPDLNLEGLEGEVKEVIKTHKGKPVSANLPVKAQFVKEGDGGPVKFFAHLKEDEFEVVN